MKKTHRDVEFDVHRLDDGHWEWIAYPKLGEGNRFGGAVEGDEEKATAAARAAIDGWLDSTREPRESPGAFQASAFDPTAFQVNTPAGAIAGPAPGEIKLEGRITGAFEGAGSLAANADVASAQRRVTTTITANLAANLPDNRAIAHGLLQVTQAKIAELREARLNDPETASLIKLLEWLAKGLTQLVENLDRAIAQPSEPMFLGTAGEIARNLKLGLLEAVEKHRIKVWEVGAAVGVACFLSSLSGERLSDILRILFGKK